MPLLLVASFFVQRTGEPATGQRHGGDHHHWGSQDGAFRGGGSVQCSPLQLGVNLWKMLEEGIRIHKACWFPRTNIVLHRLDWTIFNWTLFTTCVTWTGQPKVTCWSPLP